MTKGNKCIVPPDTMMQIGLNCRSKWVSLRKCKSDRQQETKLIV